MITPERRQLKFDTLEDAVRDAENLLAAGYTKVGNWTLGQITGHLANWLSYTMDGFPKMPLALRPVMRIMRNTIGREQLRKVLATGDFGERGPTIPQSVPSTKLIDAECVAKFRALVARLMNHTGPIHPSPLSGALTKDDAARLHTLHAAHHLSFATLK